MSAMPTTFASRGTLKDPQVTVNPLSVLVPGLIRDLFAALTKDAGEDGAVPPASRR